MLFVEETRGIAVVQVQRLPGANDRQGQHHREQHSDAPAVKLGSCPAAINT